jgi:hypothetical protein
MPERVIVRTPDNKEFSIDLDLVAERWPGSTILSWEDGRRYAGPQPSETVDADDQTDDDETTDEATDDAPLFTFMGAAGGMSTIPVDDDESDATEITDDDASGEDHLSPVRHPDDTGAVSGSGEEPS